MLSKFQPFSLSFSTEVWAFAVCTSIEIESHAKCNILLRWELHYACSAKNIDSTMTLKKLSSFFDYLLSGFTMVREVSTFNNALLLSRNNHTIWTIFLQNSGNQQLSHCYGIKFVAFWQYLSLCSHRDLHRLYSAANVVIMFQVRKKGRPGPESWSLRGQQYIFFY